MVGCTAAFACAGRALHGSRSGRCGRSLMESGLAGALEAHPKIGRYQEPEGALRRATEACQAATGGRAYRAEARAAKARWHDAITQLVSSFIVCATAVGLSDGSELLVLEGAPAPNERAEEESAIAARRAGEDHPYSTG